MTAARVITRADVLGYARELGYDAGTIDTPNGGHTVYAAWPYTGGDSIFRPYAYLFYDEHERASMVKLNDVRQTGLNWAQRVLVFWKWLEENAPVDATRRAE